jgi:biotin carboxyl carrier protein
LKDTSINNKEAHSIQPSKDVDDIKIGGRVNIVRAPIPGLITALLVQPGYEVSAGQELCKLEAMKMNNSIRSTRTGKIAKIYVSVGQQVQHNEVLMEYAG